MEVVCPEETLTFTKKWIYFLYNGMWILYEVYVLG